MASSGNSNLKPTFNLSRHRYKVWLISGVAIFISLIGLISSWLNPSIGLPLRPGLDFTGGTQIRLERECVDLCKPISASYVSEKLESLSLSSNDKFSSVNLSNARVQFLDGSKSLLLRLPFLSASQSDEVVSEMINVVGPFESGGQSIETIGPTLGAQLLRTTLISLLVAFLGIASYISFRFDWNYAYLALLALLHDVIIVCGVFSWLGIFLKIEINSLFAVAILTIAGYSVNDTVVVFDRIREINKSNKEISIAERVDIAVSSTLTRTLYTSGTTLLPLSALVFFGGSTLFWFSIALSIGVVVGSWSSIALAPSFIGIRK